MSGYTNMPLTTSSISKGHFNDVAAIFKQINTDITTWANLNYTTVGENLMLRVATQLASLYGAANPNFDRTMFLRACAAKAPRRGGSAKPVTAAVKNSAADLERIPANDNHK